MKPRNLFYSALPTTLITVACSVLAANFATAASQTWTGGTDANWATGTNWSGAAAPGTVAPSATYVRDIVEVATFNSALVSGTRGGSTDPITYENQRYVRSILFDTANVGPYVFGTAGGNQLWLGHSGSATMTAAATSSQSFASDVQVRLPSSTDGTFSIVNNATNSAAILTFTGTVSSGAANTRPLTLTLDGSNTGNNAISGVLTHSGGQRIALIKNGVGTWILSNANDLGANTTGTNAGSVTINGGLLVAQNNAALSTNVANSTPVFINSGGTLELTGGITLDNGVSLTPASGGTIRSNGTNITNGRVNVSNVAATSVTLSTVGSGDIFTIGNGTNDFTGGASDTVVHIAGPGTVLQNVASNYAGTWSVDTGILNLGSATALGTLGSVNIASGAKIQTLGISPTLTVLTGSGTVSNGIAGTSTLTTNIASLNSFAGSLQDGVAGTLVVTKSGAGTLNLSGASTYTGATTISTGVLNLTGSLGNTATSGGSGATLSGNGTIAGGVTIGSNVHIAPGDGGDAAIGTMTVGSLALNTGSQLDFGITNTTTLDKVAVSTSNGLTVTGGQLNINGGLSAFTAIGTYPLISHTGTAIANINSLLTVNSLNKSVTRTYTFTDSGGFVNLVVANSGVVQTFWNVNADGNWSTNSNWTPATAPNAVQAFVGFGGGGTEITVDRTVTVNGSFTAGTLAFNGAAFGKSYTLADGGGSNITLDNGASGSGVTDSSGNHTINSPLTLTGNGVTFAVINGADTLTVGGAIGGSGTPLIKVGSGTLALNGSNTYTNGTTIDAGTLLINNAASMGDAASTTTLNAATLRATADISGTRPFNIGNAASTISVASGITYTIGGVIADAPSLVGTLNKADSGTLALTGTNTYTGGTVINAGTVQINNPGSLGDAAGAVTINNSTLQATASFTGTRNVVLGNANSSISVDPGVTYTVSGVISGGGTLNKIGTGTLSLGSNANSYTGSTVITSGTLAVNLNSFVNGTVTFMGGTWQNNYGANTAYFTGNPISVPAGQVGTINMNNRMSLGGSVSGSGTLTLNLNSPSTRDDLTNSWTGFTGQLNFVGSGTARLLNNGGAFNTASFANCSVDVSGSAFIQSVTNSGAGNTYLIGALSGSTATAGFSGGTVGTSTLSVGSLGTSTTFAGQINGNSALTKTGAGTLTLSGVNAYTGTTTVSAGELDLATTGQLRFVPAANGVSNKITGAGTVVLDGSFNIDLTAANSANGNSWTLVDVGTLTETYGGSFTVVGFTPSGTTWTKVDGGKTWTFDQTTGVLGLVSVGYASWAGDVANGLSAGVNDGATQDPDADGIVNLMEYVLGGIPAGAGASDLSILPTETLDATDLTLTFHRSDLSESDTTLKVQWSTDMVTWSDFVTVGAVSALPAVQVTEDVPSATLDTVVVKIPRTGHEVGGKLFGRVQAVK